MSLERAVQKQETLRVVGFDDSPFDRDARAVNVFVSGIVCAGTRFEGMVSTKIRKDGWNATSKVVDALRDGKFLPQLHMVLFDGIALGGFNVVDISAVSMALQIPAVAVMRSEPDFDAIALAVECLPRPEQRLEMIQRAGDIHAAEHCFFQVAGAEAEVVAQALPLLTDSGHIPEAIRIAHLVGSAVVTGESGKRA